MFDWLACCAVLIGEQNRTIDRRELVRVEFATEALSELFRRPAALASRRRTTTGGGKQAGSHPVQSRLPSPSLVRARTHAQQMHVPARAKSGNGGMRCVSVRLSGTHRTFLSSAWISLLLRSQEENKPAEGRISDAN